VQRVHHVLNECLVDRGSSPAMVCLDCYVDGHHLTTVQVGRIPRALAPLSSEAMRLHAQPARLRVKRRLLALASFSSEAMRLHAKPARLGVER